MSKNTPKDIKKLASKIILRAAMKYRIAPYEVPPAQFWACANGELTDWDMRKVGGASNFRAEEFPVPEGMTISDVYHPKKFVAQITKLYGFNTHVVSATELFKTANLKNDEIFRMIVQPDTHVEEHDHATLNAFIKFVEWYKPHGLVNLGDFMEMDAVSHWPAKDARPRRLVPQIQTGIEILSRIKEAAGKQCAFWRFIIGNHEDWLNQYLTARIPEVLDGLSELGHDLTVEGLLKLEEFGYKVIPNNEILRIGEHCHFIHGYYTCNAHAKKHLDVFGVNVYYGHLHDVQGTSTVSVNGVHEALSLGCLRSMDAAFLKGKPNNWSHAFGIFEFRSDGSFTRYVPIIIKGRFSFNGTMFDGNVA